ncbi:MAG: hypothetical protein ACPG5U_07230 [Planktomarina sp.]
MTTKIATCCYCGTRAALTLKGKVQHELACGTCGAPLHDLKHMPLRHEGKASKVKPSRVRVKPDDPIKGYKWDEAAKKTKKPKKKKKSFARWLIEEIKDEIEDIFD